MKVPPILMKKLHIVINEIVADLFKGSAMRGQVAVNPELIHKLDKFNYLIYKYLLRAATRS